jgi:hypothetical protein
VRSLVARRGTALGRSGGEAGLLVLTSCVFSYPKVPLRPSELEMFELPIWKGLWAHGNRSIDQR